MNNHFVKHFCQKEAFSNSFFFKTERLLVKLIISLALCSVSFVSIDISKTVVIYTWEATAEFDHFLAGKACLEVDVLYLLKIEYSALNYYNRKIVTINPRG